MNWEEFYPQVLKAQVLYEQGLARLSAGDRTVWGYNDRGILLDALNIQNYWCTALINSGPHGDVFFEGKYVEEMTRAVDDASFYVKATTGVVESMQAEPPAHDFWSEQRMERLNREVPFPAALPQVLEPGKEVICHTGQPVPCDGIFEPLVPDGRINYFLQGASTPKAVNVDKMKGGLVVRPAAWRLLWEDVRYLDGVIPPEEQSHFPQVAPLAAPRSSFADPDPLIKKNSNEFASKSGMWVISDRLDLRQQFHAGDRLTQHEGRDVTWIGSSKA